MSRLKTDAIRNVNASVDGITLDTSGNVAIPNELQLADKIVHTGDTNTAIRFPSADVITAETSGTERIRVTSGGLVLLGSSTSDLSGNHSFISIGSRHALQYGASAGTYLSFIMGSANGNVTLETSARSGNYPPLAFKVGGSERLRITPDGPHLLLGGTNDVNEITEGAANAGIVIGNTSTYGNAGIAIITKNDGCGRIYFGDGVTNSAGRGRGSVNYYHNGDHMDIYTAGSHSIRIDDQGKIGLGVTSPARELHLKTAGNCGIRIEGGTNHTCQVLFTPAGGTEHQGRIGYFQGDDAMDFYTAGAERLRITSGGVVGIGSTSPGSSSKVFSYQSDASAGNNIILENNYNANGTTTLLKAYRQGGAVGYALQYKDSDTRIRQGTYTNHAMELVTNDNARLTLHNDGHARFSNAISFNNETATANRLDDYETGTWTVTDLTSDGVTFINQSNRYTKIGRQVFVQANIQFPNSGLSGAAMKMGGLPFTPGTGTTSSGIVSVAVDVSNGNGYANGVQLHIDTDGIHATYDGALRKGAFGNSQFQNRAVCFAFSYST